MSKLLLVPLEDIVVFPNMLLVGGALVGVVVASVIAGGIAGARAAARPDERSRAR